MDIILQTTTGVFTGGVLLACFLWAAFQARKTPTWDGERGLVIAGFVGPLLFALAMFIAYS